MTEEEWATSSNARTMLKALHLKDPKHFVTLTPTLHKYLIACCWKIKYLIPQKHLRDGLRGAEEWIEGQITNDELSKLDWYAEAEAFAIDYAQTPAELDEIKALIESIKELKGMPFEQARKLLCDAAYFANHTMMYQRISSAPYTRTLRTSEFLCPDLLRQYVQPVF